MCWATDARDWRGHKPWLRWIFLHQWPRLRLPSGTRDGRCCLTIRTNEYGASRVWRRQEEQA